MTRDPSRTIHTTNIPAMPEDWVCPECGGALPRSNQARQLFCSEPHRRKYQRRIEKRGYRYLVPALVSRITRQGTRGDKITGDWASLHANRMAQDFADEDREAGRMSLVDYYRARLALGLTD